MSPSVARAAITSASPHVLAIAGSLRRDSLNRRLVQAMAGLSADTASIETFDALADLPLFNEDLETPPVPDSIARLREAVAIADGLLIATPEYNQALPAVTKNVVDWLSRGEVSVLEGKPVAILGVTPGSWGTRHAQAQLRHTLAACGALVMPAPQVYLRNGDQLFDDQNVLIDARTRESLNGFLASFGRWMRLVSRTGEGMTP